MCVCVNAFGPRPAADLVPRHCREEEEGPGSGPGSRGPGGLTGAIP